MAINGTSGFSVPFREACKMLSNLLENQYYTGSFNPSLPLELLFPSTKTHILLFRARVYLIHMREDPARILLVHQVMQIILLRRQSAHQPLPRPRVMRWMLIGAVLIIV
jgi:hypothetical protein